MKNAVVIILVGGSLLAGCGSSKQLTKEQARKAFRAADVGLRDESCEQGGSVKMHVGAPKKTPPYTAKSAVGGLHFSIEACKHDGIVMNGNVMKKSLSASRTHWSGMISFGGALDADCNVDITIDTATDEITGLFCGYEAAELAASNAP